MISKNFYPFLEAVLFSLLIVFISRIFGNEWRALNVFYVTYWVCIVLLLLFWIMLCILDLHKVFGGTIMTSYSEIRNEIKKNKKAVIILFLFFQIINNALFGTLGYFNMDLAYQDYLDVIAISILFVATWEYFNYFKLFRLEVLKKVPTSSLFGGTFAFKSIILLIEAGILVYQIITILYFVLLVNQNVDQKTLNCYLKLLFILFVFKILGASCQKYLKKLLLCASLFALIGYDWYVFIIEIAESDENERFFDFFIIVFIFTHGYFMTSCYCLYKEWNIYRYDLRRPRRGLDLILNNNVNNNDNNMFKNGLSDEEIKNLPIEIYQRNTRIDGLDKIICSICTFDVNKGDEIYRIPCKHVFHSKCLVPWVQINKICPNCRKCLSNKSNPDIYPDNEMLNQV